MTALPGAGGITAAWKMRGRDGQTAWARRSRGCSPPRRRTGSAQTAVDGASRLMPSPTCAIEAIARRSAVRRRLHARLAAARVRLLHRELHRRAGARARAWSRWRSACRCSAATGGWRAACRARRGCAQWDGGGPGSTMGIAGVLGLSARTSALVATASIGDDQTREGRPPRRGGRLRPRGQLAGWSTQQIEAD